MKFKRLDPVQSASSWEHIFLCCMDAKFCSNHGGGPASTDTDKHLIQRTCGNGYDPADNVEFHSPREGRDNPDLSLGGSPRERQTSRIRDIMRRRKGR